MYQSMGKLPLNIFLGSFSHLRLSSFIHIVISGKMTVFATVCSRGKGQSESRSKHSKIKYKVLYYAEN